jgi:hypothetical protein
MILKRFNYGQVTDLYMVSGRLIEHFVVAMQIEVTFSPCAAFHPTVECLYERFRAE